MESPNQTAPTEAVSVDQFVKLLLDTGLLPADEVRAFASAIPVAQRQDARPLAQELMKQGKLTKYQASMLYAGKSKGLVLGNYAILDKIGQGGMGMVFKAQHRRLPRVVAIKVLPLAVTKDANAVKRFEREVQAAAKLNHPNIVAARDAGQDLGVHFLVMEFVEGSDLANLVKKQGPLPITQAVDCILQAARGLAYAHQSGVIHRDIKPHNLLLDKSGAVKILDMGLARFDGAENNASATASELTKSGSIMGTVDYMAPEQAVNTKKADHRADIYSLGCTLYYLVSGNPIYGGETSMEKLLAHREEPIPPLPNVSKKLQAIYQKMVAKKAEARYQAMAEVVADLEACQASGGADDRVTTPLVAGKRRTAAVQDAETQPHVESADTDELPARPAPRPGKRLVLVGAAAGGALVLLLVALLVLWPRSSSSLVAGPTAPAAQPTVAAKEIDLLKLIDPKRDSVRGLWRWEGQTLVSPRGTDMRLQVPFSPPSEYELEIHAARMEGTHNLNIGLVASGRQFLVNLDGYGASISGFHLLDGKSANVNESTYRGKVFTTGQPASIVLVVHRQGVTVRVDGKTIIDWHGDFSRLSMDEKYAVHDAKQLAVGAFNSTFHISKMVLRPLGKESQTPSGPGSKVDDAWIQSVQKLPPEEQIDKVMARLKELNPRMNPKTFGKKIDGAVVTELAFLGAYIDELSPVRALTGLKKLHLGVPFGHETSLNLSGLKGMSLIYLDLYNTRAKDLSPLQGMPLTFLNCQSCGPDYSILKELPALREVHLNFQPARDAELLRSIRTLEQINGKPAAEFWKAVGEGPKPLDEAWVKQVAGMTPERQVAAVVAELQRRNPGFDGKVEHQIGKGTVIDVYIVTDAVTDLSPLRALSGLRSLTCRGSNNSGKVKDLSPLTGLPLTNLDCQSNPVADLSPLQGMPLQRLVIHATAVKDLTPLARLPLKELTCSGTNIADLSPLAGTPLTALHCPSTRVSDFSPLKGLPLKEISGNFNLPRDAAILRSINTLEKINGKPAAEFWKQFPEK